MDLLPRSERELTDWYSFVIEVLPQLLIIRKCECLNDIKKRKMKQVCFWPSPFVHAVVMALVAAIVRRN